MRLADLFENTPAQEILVTYPDPIIGSDELNAYLTKNARIVARYIMKNCKPWLTRAGNKVVYRGTKSFPDMALAIIKKVRQDRRPVDSSREFTRIYQLLIDMAGGKANRTNSMFVTGDQYATQDYGTSYVVFPIGDFHYTWSPLFKDWFTEIEDSKYPIYAVRQLLNSKTLSQVKSFQITEYPSRQDQAKLMSNPKSYSPTTVRNSIYADRGLQQAISNEVEIMIQCTSGIYLDLAFYRNLVEPLLLEQ